MQLQWSGKHCLNMYHEFHYHLRLDCLNGPCIIIPDLKLYLKVPTRDRHGSSGSFPGAVWEGILPLSWYILHRLCFALQHSFYIYKTQYILHLNLSFLFYSFLSLYFLLFRLTSTASIFGTWNLVRLWSICGPDCMDSSRIFISLRFVFFISFPPTTTLLKQLPLSTLDCTLGIDNEGQGGIRKG